MHFLKTMIVYFVLFFNKSDSFSSELVAEIGLRMHLEDKAERLKV